MFRNICFMVLAALLVFSVTAFSLYQFNESAERYCSNEGSMDPVCESEMQ